MSELDSEISWAEQELLPESTMFFSILVFIEIHWFDLKLLVCVCVRARARVFCIIMEHHFLEREANNCVIYVE